MASSIFSWQQWVDVGLRRRSTLASRGRHRVPKTHQGVAGRKREHNK